MADGAGEGVCCLGPGGGGYGRTEEGGEVEGEAGGTEAAVAVVQEDWGGGFDGAVLLRLVSIMSSSG